MIIPIAHHTETLTLAKFAIVFLAGFSAPLAVMFVSLVEWICKRNRDSDSSRDEMIEAQQQSARLDESERERPIDFDRLALALYGRRDETRNSDSAYFGQF